MAISLAILFRTTILVSLIALSRPWLCTSHPQARLIQSNLVKHQDSPTKKSGLDNLWTVVSHVTSIPNPAAFLANISIGDPPVPQLLLIDTGSDLIWIQCLPGPKNIPFFHPSRSSSYRNASCKPARNGMPRIIRERKTGTCQYYLRYRDFSSTRGVLAKEKLTFHISEDGLLSERNVVFGCGQDNSGFTKYSGVLGLGPGKFSIVTRNFDSKFSYRFGSLTDPTYPPNILILGKGARTEGTPTPLQIYQDRYYLDLQAISFGRQLLEIDSDVFKRYGSQGGTLIDTGCSTTILVREAYDTLAEEIEFALGQVQRRVEDWEQYTNPCYHGNIKLNLYSFPLVTFHFAGGAELALDIDSLFVGSENGDRFCLAMRMNMFDDMNVIGAVAQQNYNVGYNLRTMKVYFQRTEYEPIDS